MLEIFIAFEDQHRVLISSLLRFFCKMLFVDLESTKQQIEQDSIKLEDLVTSRKIQIDSDKIPAWYKIFYNDSGCFSNADWWQRIFHAFLQSDRETEISAMMISGLIKSVAITEFKPSPALGNVLSFLIIFIIINII